MQLDRVIDLATDFFQHYVQRSGRAIGVTPAQAGWTVEIEAVEESEYMRRHGRDDILAVYEVSVTAELEIAGYRRKHLRSRNALENSAEVETCQ